MLFRSTFGYWWVRQGISRAITRDDRVIRLPVAAVEALNKLRGFVPAFVQEHGRQPSYAECAKHCDVAEDTMRGYIRHSSPATSLDQRANGNDNASMLIDLIAAEAEDPLADDFWEVRQYLKPVMANLPPEQKEVIQLRFFSQPDDSLTSYQLMAEKLGTSRQAVQQRQERALRAMRLRMAIA